MKIGAIVLAAGRSRRMGTQKLLLPLRDKPIIAHIVDTVVAGPIDHTAVVLGPEHENVRQALRGCRVQFTVNPDSAGDMLSSVRCGLQTLPATCEAALVVLGDQPGITTGMIRRLIGAYPPDRPGIVVPTCQGHRGHPILFSLDYRDEIIERHDGVGLRGLLQNHQAEITTVEVSQPGCLDDLDWPADYQRLKARWLGSGPSPESPA